MADAESRIRIDKWLWAARFYKTRALAGEAVGGGKVHLRGQRIKPSRMVKLGDCYQIQRGFELFEIEVTGLAARRGSATQAATLYRETETSRQRRERETLQRRLSNLQQPRNDQRPDKKQRRQIRRFTGKA